MTVEELIKELEKIGDKTKEVYLVDESWGNLEVNEVIIDERSYRETILLKN